MKAIFINFGKDIIATVWVNALLILWNEALNDIIFRVYRFYWMIVKPLWK